MFAPDLRHHALLDHDQEIALSRRIQSGDADALDELVRHNLRMVYKIAERYYTTDPGTEFSDLVQEGLIGLLTAARRYDPDRGTRFSTYAYHWIRQAVGYAARTAGTIPRYANPDYQPVKPAVIRAHAIRQAPIARLDAPIRDRHGDDSNSTLIDLLADEAASVEDQVLSAIEVERIITALNLTERGEATVRDWLAGLSREEAGRRHGLSRSWIDTRLKVSNAYHFKEKIMPPHQQITTCMESGCHRPLYVTERGATFPRCEEHQKEYWRLAAKIRSEKEKGTAAPKTSRPKQPKVNPMPTPAAPLYEMERESGSEESAPPHHEQESAGGESSECTCPDCIYREVIDLLAARNPRIADLVAAMEKARQLRDDLGI